MGSKHPFVPRHGGLKLLGKTLYIGMILA